MKKHDMSETPAGDEEESKGWRFPSTLNRPFMGLVHRPPRSGVDNTGAPWRGASRIIDRPARRRRNKASWKRLLLRERQMRTAALKAAETPTEENT
jgi:hypothetical protein